MKGELKMSEDFFGDLGKSITKATQQAVDKTSIFFESTKISAQISSEQKEIEKLYQNIGEAVYRQIKAGTLTPGEDIRAAAEEIKGHETQINVFKKNLADVKGMKICPNCREVIPSDVAFCPKCGAPTPVAKTVEANTAAEEEEPETAESPEKPEETAAAAAPQPAEAVTQPEAEAAPETKEDVSGGDAQ